MRAATKLTWFGGYEGVLVVGDHRLHLIADDGCTFCGVLNGMYAVSARYANSDKCDWCETCHRKAQEHRRDA